VRDFDLSAEGKDEVEKLGVGRGVRKETNAEGRMRVSERPALRRGICSLGLNRGQRIACKREVEKWLTGRRRGHVRLRG
jgi:hypothetical protein